jgi:hypothetical protein
MPKSTPIKTCEASAGMVHTISKKVVVQEILHGLAARVIRPPIVLALFYLPDVWNFYSPDV